MQNEFTFILSSCRVVIPEWLWRIIMPEEVCFTTLLPEEFIKMLKDKKYVEVARATGFTHPTIARLAQGKTDEVSLHIKAEVTKYLLKNPLEG